MKKDKKSSDDANSQNEILENVFKQHLPSMALKQIAEIVLLILDKIFKIPNEWTKALTPIITWLTLHIEDKLVETLFTICPTLNQELSRLHQLLKEFIDQEFLIKKLKEDEEQ